MLTNINDTLWVFKNLGVQMPHLAPPLRVPMLRCQGKIHLGVKLELFQINKNTASA